MRFLDADYWIGFLSAVAGWLFSFMVPTAPFVGIVMFLVFADFVTGTRAAMKRGEKITSKGLRRTVEKISLYFLAILAVEGVRIIFVQTIPITYMTAFAIAITELQSIVENVESVTGVQIWKTLKDTISAPFQKKS